MGIPFQSAFSPAALPPMSPIDIQGQQAALRAAFAAPRPYRLPHAFLLLLRFALVNVVALALLAAAWAQGWIGLVAEADPTHQCAAIAGVFLVGLALCTAKTWRVSRELNELQAEAPAPWSRTARYLERVRGRDASSRAIAAGALRAKLMVRIGAVRHIASTLVVLGLLGTVVGFIMALSGVRPDIAADARAVSSMVSTLIAGMSVALYTTLVGSLLNIWLMVCFHILASGTVRLVAGIVERGEADAGA
jgi:hypothetical protein